MPKYNAHANEVDLTLETTDTGLKLRIPKKLILKDVKVQVSLYMTSEQKLDFDLPLSLAQELLCSYLQSFVEMSLGP